MKKNYFTKDELNKKHALAYMTRRSFMETGLKLSGTVAVPSLVRSLFHETSAYAEVVNNGLAAFPVVQIHLAGGWGGAIVPLNSAGNALSGGALSRYGVLPEIASQPGRILEVFGIPFFDRTLNPPGTVNPGAAGTQFDFIQGLVQKLPTPNPANIQAFSVANNGQDDNNTNPMGMNSVLLAAGFKASLVDSVGISRTSTGMSNTSVLSAFRSAPFIAPNPRALQDLFAYCPALAGRSESILAGFAGALKRISDKQASRIFDTVENRESILSGISSAHQENMNFTVPSTTNIDATTDTNFVNAFAGMFTPGQALSANTPLASFATGLKGLLMGHINFVGYTLPFGYDYHGQMVLDNGATLGTLSRDRIAGQMLGTIMNLALAANKNMILVLTSDGACQGKGDHTLGADNVNTNLWTGDRGQQNLIHFYAINAGGGSLTRNHGIQQIGAMRTDSGTVNTSTLSGKGDMAASSVIAANILYLNGVSPDDILKIFPLFSSTTHLMEHLVLTRA